MTPKTLLLCLNRAKYEHNFIDDVMVDSRGSLTQFKKMRKKTFFMLQRVRTQDLCDIDTAL